MCCKAEPAEQGSLHSPRAERAECKHRRMIMRVSCAIFRLLVQFPVDTSLLQRYGGTSDDVLRIKVYWVLTSVQQLVEHFCLSEGPWRLQAVPVLGELLLWMGKRHQEHHSRRQLLTVCVGCWVCLQGQSCDTGLGTGLPSRFLCQPVTRPSNGHSLYHRWKPSGGDVFYT